MTHMQDCPVRAGTTVCLSHCNPAQRAAIVGLFNVVAYSHSITPAAPRTPGPAAAWCSLIKVPTALGPRVQVCYSAEHPSGDTYAAWSGLTDMVELHPHDVLEWIQNNI